MDYEFDHPKNANCFACRTVLVRAATLQNTDKRQILCLCLGFGSKPPDCSTNKLTLYMLCGSRLPKSLHRLHHWQDIYNTKPVCVCTLDVLAYFGCKNCNHLSKDQWNKYLVIWAVMMSALIVHTNQVHGQMCAVGGGEFVDVFEPTSLFRLSWTHPGSDVSAELVNQRALSYPLLARARPWVKLGCIIPALWLPRPSAESRGDILRILENHQSIS